LNRSRQTKENAAGFYLVLLLHYLDDMQFSLAVLVRGYSVSRTGKIKLVQMQECDEAIISVMNVEKGNLDAGREADKQIYSMSYVSEKILFTVAVVKVFFRLVQSSFHFSNALY
jgi:hypothetical protein